MAIASKRICRVDTLIVWLLVKLWWCLEKIFDISLYPWFLVLFQRLYFKLNNSEIFNYLWLLKMRRSFQFFWCPKTSISCNRLDLKKGKKKLCILPFKYVHIRNRWRVKVNVLCVSNKVSSLFKVSYSSIVIRLIPSYWLFH